MSFVIWQNHGCCVKPFLFYKNNIFKKVCWNENERVLIEKFIFRKCQGVDKILLLPWWNEETYANKLLSIYL